MLDNNRKNKEIELVKLISFGYDLHEDKLKSFDADSELFPRFYTYSGYSYETKRIPDGIVWGKRGYANHSTSTVFTNLGLTIGKIDNEKLNLDYAILFSIDNKRENLHISLLKCKDDNVYEPELDYSNEWDKLSKEERIKLFIKSMVSLGYKIQDVRDVMVGRMSARDAYMNIAEGDKKKRQWIDFGRRRYIFDDNVAIMGNFGAVYSFDKIPFPFDGMVVIDCSKCKTSSIDLKDNKRKVRLINVNQNKDSIRFANLRNAIIDEVINLSMVDASYTTFGHHRLTGIEYSIAKLDTMDCTLACDEYGNKLKVNEYGKIQTNFFGEPELVDRKIGKTKIKVFSNVDNEEMLKETLENNSDGIGLARTETLFYDREKIKKYVKLFLEFDENKELLNDFKMEQRNLLNLIFANFHEKRIVIRLFDFRFNDILKNAMIKKSELEDMYYFINDTENFRGANYLIRNEALLRFQLEAILESCLKYGIDINILVPYIENELDFIKIKQIAQEVNKNIGANFKIGAMIENKLSAINADIIARQSDFISIGLNDLTQSVIEMSRDTNDSAFYYLNDEVKNIISETIYRITSVRSDISIGICGEHVNYLENIEFFRSLELDYLSVNPYNILGIKASLENGIKEYTLEKK